MCDRTQQCPECRISTPCWWLRDEPAPADRTAATSLEDTLDAWFPLLARETNGDLGDLLPRWTEELGETSTAAGRRILSRRFARRLVRTGFTLVMPR